MLQQWLKHGELLAVAVMQQCGLSILKKAGDISAKERMLEQETNQKRPYKVELGAPRATLPPAISLYAHS